MNRVLAACAALAAFSACVTYDFEPVNPIAVSQTTRAQTVAATGAKPNVMLLLDKSGSMAGQIDASCTSNCRTRIDDLRAAMGPFLAQYGAVARFGLTTFPAGSSGAEVCSPPTGVRLDISQSNDVDADLLAHAAQIDSVVQQIGGSEAVGGGTPTAATLGMVGSLQSLNDADRKDVVVLLTDGLPNCNAMNPVTTGQGGTCICTSSPAVDPYCSGTGVRGCLDDVAAVQAVRDLAARGIQTAVIGFGADTSGSNVLDLMAAEGGLPRTCKVDLDCGTAGPCNSGICRTRYYQANDGSQLADVLKKIVGNLGTPCEYQLGFTPEPNAKLSVLIDGQAETEDPANGWRYDAASSTVLFAGSLCDRAMQTTVLKPMQVEIRVLEVVQ